MKSIPLYSLLIVLGAVLLTRLPASPWIIETLTFAGALGILITRSTTRALSSSILYGAVIAIGITLTRLLLAAPTFMHILAAVLGIGAVSSVVLVYIAQQNQWQRGRYEQDQTNP